MARAHRHYEPGYVWHLTHRCHDRDFLLKFARDRRAWENWLFEARRRFDLCVFNYTATSNHVHLLVRDRGGGEIAAAVQLVDGCTAQAYNRRKGRRGAYWEDNYHATAVETGAHLVRCLTYIDLNMVRAGVVNHPRDWPVGGYHEIQQARSRKRIIDREALADALELNSVDELAAAHREWLADALERGGDSREPMWTEAVAVGSREFAERAKREIGSSARHRDVTLLGDAFVLRESPAESFASCEDEMAGLAGGMGH